MPAFHVVVETEGQQDMRGKKRFRKKVATLISIASDSELTYWCNRLRVSPVLLMQTVAIAGLALADIENALILSENR